MELDSFLLNVWREVGAYVRYGDAKLLAVIGLATGFLYAQISYLSINEKFALQDIVLLGSVEVSLAHRVSVALSIFSCAIGLASFFPTLSKYSFRTKFFLRVGTSFKIIPAREGSAKSVYFAEIATYANLDAFQRELKEQFVQEEKFTDRQIQISDQIIILSRIAASKYTAIYLLTGLLILSTIVFVIGVMLQKFS